MKRPWRCAINAWLPISVNPWLRSKFGTGSTEMPLSPARRAFVLGLALSVGGCATGGPAVFTPSPRPSADFPDIRYANWTDAEPPYRLYPGDQVDLAVPSAPELNKTLTV